MKTIAVFSTYKILIVIFIVYVVDWMLYVIYYHSCIANISLLERRQCEKDYLLIYLQKSESSKQKIHMHM